MNGLDIDERPADRWQWAPLWIAAGLLLLAVVIGPSVVRYELDLAAPAVFVVPDELTLAAAIGPDDAPDADEAPAPAAQEVVQAPPASTASSSPAVMSPASIPVAPSSVPAAASDDVTPAPTAPATPAPATPGPSGAGAGETPVTPSSRWNRAAMSEPTPVATPEVVTPRPQPSPTAEDCTSVSSRWSSPGASDSCDANDGGSRRATTDPTVSESAMQVDDDSTSAGSRWRSPGPDASPTRPGRR